MTRYFFNTRIGDDTIPDVEGEELRDADHAWEVAKAMIVDLLEEQAEYPNILTAALVVTDQKGEVVLEFPFAEALTAPDETPTPRPQSMSGRFGRRGLIAEAGVARRLKVGAQPRPIAARFCC